MYDFDTVRPRRGTDSVKWNVKDSELPMWIADMDFPAAPEIVQALKERAENGIFGYTRLTDEWYGAYIGWWERRHGFHIEKDWLLCCTGAVPGTASAVRHLTAPGDRVVVHTPGYGMFFSSVKNNGRELIESGLIYRDGAYSMDMADLEARFADERTTMYVHCNPHNPTGVIWSADTMAEIGRLAKKYGVIVVSDEVHCDITAPGREYIPFASVSDECREVSVSCYGPSKTFNLAGLKTGALCIPNPELREKMSRALRVDGLNEAASFSSVGAAAAFNNGDRWVDELRRYVFGNRAFAEKFIAENVPELRTVKGDATYLMWIDVRALTDDSNEFCAFLREKTGLYVSGGNGYGGDGVRFLRLNAACPRVLLEDGLERLKNGVQAWKARK